MIVHGGLLASHQSGDWRGVLIRGQSGIGKSDLALRLLARGFRLVADDRVLLFVSQGRLYGRAPKPLEGLIEIRGLDVVAVGALRLCRIFLAVDCVPSARLERVPDPAVSLLLDVQVPTVQVCPTEFSAPAKLCRAIEVLGRPREEAYDAAFPPTPPYGPTRRNQS